MFNLTFMHFGTGPTSLGWRFFAEVFLLSSLHYVYFGGRQRVIVCVYCRYPSPIAIDNPN
jgi:hypothetical protein